MSSTEIVICRGTNAPDWAFVFEGVELGGSVIEMHLAWSGGDMVLSSADGELVVAGGTVTWPHSEAQADALPLGRLTLFDLFRKTGTDIEKIAGGAVTVLGIGEMPETGTAEVPVIQGAPGWSPVFAVVPDGVSRSVLHLVDWTGGGGTPPEAGLYVGPEGLVADISDASNIRGDLTADAQLLLTEMQQVHAAVVGRLDFSNPYQSGWL